MTGDNLGVVSAGNDEYLNPCVNFRLRGDGVAKFRLLTTREPARHGRHAARSIATWASCSTNGCCPSRD